MITNAFTMTRLDIADDLIDQAGVITKLADPQSLDQLRAFAYELTLNHTMAAVLRETVSDDVVITCRDRLVGEGGEPPDLAVDPPTLRLQAFNEFLRRSIRVLMQHPEPRTLPTVGRRVTFGLVTANYVVAEILRDHVTDEVFERILGEVKAYAT